MGLGEGVQKLFYLPEVHTDFLFAVLAEEFGLAGTLTIVGLYTFIVLRALAIGRNARGRAVAVRGLPRVRHRAADRAARVRQHRGEHRRCCRPRGSPCR